ncbi:MAG: type II toxin-antitoxin system VapC family toxin [Lachnospiraceae bacterium]|nr:type II toxin-antitoxin system VapC family toxin [Lachnospiraceae bacterium]
MAKKLPEMENIVEGEINNLKMKLSKIRTFDSLHIAAAEEAKADVLLTTDDKLEKIAGKLELKVRVMNPLKFAWEEI